MIDIVVRQNCYSTMWGNESRESGLGPSVSLLKRVGEYLKQELYRATPTTAVVRQLLREEAATGLSGGVAWRRCLWLWRRGFVRYADHLYDLDEESYREYLSDYEYWSTWSINRAWSTILDNKLTAHWLLGEFEEYRPNVYGMLEDGRVLFPRDGAEDGGRPSWSSSDEQATLPADPTLDDVLSLLQSDGSLILKPVYGFGGDGIFRCSYRDGAFHLDGRQVSRSELSDRLSRLEEYLVCEYVQQADYADQLFADAANTVRLISMWDYERDEPFVGAAIHRIGTSDTVPVDNWSKGGLSADVDVETGELGQAAYWPSKSEPLQWFDSHPDSGGRIEGVRVTHWETVRETILEMAASLSFAPYLAWDVLVTEDGFAILEINEFPDLPMMQLHRPMKADPRVRAFYEYHGVL